MDKNLEEFKKFGVLTALKELSLMYKEMYEKATRCRGEGSKIILLKPERKKMQWKIPKICIDYIKAVAGVHEKHPGDYLEKIIVEDMGVNIEMFKEMEKELRTK